MTEVKRRKEEFYCDPGGGGCGMYFSTYLRDNMNGAYTIQCPKPACNHKHFRKIVNGLVTTDRDYSAQKHNEILVGLESTLRATPFHASPENKRSAMRALRS